MSSLSPVRPSLLVAALLGASLAHAQGLRPRAPAARGPGPLTRELAGKPLAEHPHFLNVRSFNAGQPVHVAFDPANDPWLLKRTVEVFVIAHEDLPLYIGGKKLESANFAPLTVEIGEGGLKNNRFLLDAGTLKGTGTPDANGTVLLGRGYDVAVDVNGNSLLDPLDLLDGSLEGPGFWVVEDFVSFKRPPLRETGPYGVTEVFFDGGSNFTQEDIYYPTNVAELGQLPLIVVSHGNGHNYQWYDHIGFHMASWGYVVMSHANNTGPGIETASSSTLRNTDLFLGSLGTIAGGALDGHVDGHRIVWIGHSRGGEGVVRAYRRLLTGTILATLYDVEDVRLVSSIAPTDFLGPGMSDMGVAPYHLWTGGADADVNGCADCDLCQTFQLLERADGTRYSTSLHGAGHGDFHAGGGSSVAAGPCLLGRPTTHEIMRAYFLPLVQHALDGNEACLDYLTRQWEEFRATGAPDPAANVCVSVDLMYLPGPESARLVIDDFQSEPSSTRSSSGGLVRASAGLAASLREGRLDDANSSFIATSGDFMNGMTLAGPGDTTAGLVFEWDRRDEWLLFEVPAGLRNVSALRTLSFRAAQSTRAELTIAELGDLDLEVQLADGSRRASTIRIGAYGGGIEEPYLRGGCGSGTARGWANEFETIRIPLADFQRDGNPLDLSNVVAIGFLFGPSHGSRSGRIGLDEIVFTGD